jgi:hypothetical protein
MTVAVNPLQMPKLAVELGFSSPAAGHSVTPAARVIVTEVSQLASGLNRRGESVGFARRTSGGDSVGPTTAFRIRAR